MGRLNPMNGVQCLSRHPRCISWCSSWMTQIPDQPQKGGWSLHPAPYMGLGASPGIQEQILDALLNPKNWVQCRGEAPAPPLGGLHRPQRDLTIRLRHQLREWESPRKKSWVPQGAPSHRKSYVWVPHGAPRRWKSCDWVPQGHPNLLTGGGGM